MKKGGGRNQTSAKRSGGKRSEKKRNAACPQTLKEKGSPSPPPEGKSEPIRGGNRIISSLIR